MLVPGLSQMELLGVLQDSEYSRLIARSALYTERSGAESGFKVARGDAQLTYHESYDRDVAIGSMSGPTEGMIFPAIPQTVASFHTHPDTGLNPKNPRYFMNCHISEDDALHMQINQRSCPTFIAGVAAKDVYNGPDKLVVGLHRSTQPLSSDKHILTGDYWRAASDQEGLQVGLPRFLGILVARIGFDIVRPYFKEPTIRPNDEWGEMHMAVARLYPDQL